MRKEASFAVFLAIIGSAGFLYSQVQDPGMPPSSVKQKSEERVDRMTCGFLSWPARDTASEQLAYARDFEARGWKRRAVRAYGMLVRAWHDSPEAVQAQFERARLLEELGKYRLAFDEYEYLLAQFSAGFPYYEVLDHQFRIANQVMTERHWDFLGLPGYTVPEAALPMWEKIVKSAPAWEKTPQVLFFVASTHEAGGDFDEALLAYTRLRNRYPDSPFSAESDLGRARCLHEIHKTSPRDEQACRDALSSLAMFLRDYPEHPGAKDVQQRLDAAREQLAAMYYDRALFYEKGSHKKPGAALIAYRDFVLHFPGSSYALAAAGRISELEKQLEVSNAQ